MLITTVVAVNNAENSANPIHRDEEARALGMQGGLVGGTTLFEYLSLPAVQLWGTGWVESGSMTARFRAPVYDGEELEIRTHDPLHEGGERRVELVGPDGVSRSEGVIGPPVTNGPRPTPLSYSTAEAGAELPLIGYDSLASLPVLVGLQFEPHAERPGAASKDLGNIVHPANVANVSIAIMYQTFRAEMARVHTGLATKQYRAVAYGEKLSARGRIIKAWRYKDRTYATNDVLVSDAEARPVMHIQNTTIWEFAG